MLKWLRANTLGTYLFTRRRGEFVGEDEFGNKYYRERGAKDWRTQRRWVVFAGDSVEIEASAVPPGWLTVRPRARTRTCYCAPNVAPE